MDEWTEQLSEYVDGDLNATSTAALEQHLRVCAECTAIVADLRAIAADAAALQTIAPSRDLWPDIAAQIGETGRAADGATDSAARGARVIHLDAHRNVRRSITLSIPQLATAAVLLLAVGAVVWQMGSAHSARNNTGASAANTIANATHNTADNTSNTSDNTTPNGSPNTTTDATRNGMQRAVTTGGATQGTLRTVATRSEQIAQTPGYDAAITQLEQAAAQNETRLDPETRRIIAQSMNTIDRAIADARAALAADPANVYLHRHLDRTMKQKSELLRQTAKINRGGA